MCDDTDLYKYLINNHTYLFVSFSEVSERSHWNCFPALPQKVLPAALVSVAFHHLHWDSREENPVFLKLSACGRWENKARSESHLHFNNPKLQLCFCYQGQLERVRSFWSDTTNSSSIECSQNVKTEVSDFFLSFIWYLIKCLRGNLTWCVEMIRWRCFRTLCRKDKWQLTFTCLLFWQKNNSRFAKRSWAAPWQERMRSLKVIQRVRTVKTSEGSQLRRSSPAETRFVTILFLKKLFLCLHLFCIYALFCAFMFPY